MGGYADDRGGTRTLLLMGRRGPGARGHVPARTVEAMSK